MKKKNKINIEHRCFQNFGKRPLVFLGMLFLGLIINAQEYKSRFKNDICNCLEEAGPSVRTIENTFQQCFRKTLPDYAAIIDSQITETETAQVYLEGQKIRQELILIFQSDLIYTCDFYYTLYEKGRQAALSTMRANAEASRLEELNQLVALSPNASSYAQRGSMYFVLEDLKNAEQDLQKAIELNAFTNDAKITLAWVFEEQKKFNASKMLLDEIFLNKYQRDIALLRAIVIRKMGGKEDIPKVVNPISDTPKETKEQKDDVLNEYRKRRAVNRRGQKGIEKPKSTNTVDKKEVLNLFKRKKGKGGSI